MMLKQNQFTLRVGRELSNFAHTLSLRQRGGAKTLAIVAAPTDSITAKSNIVGFVSSISHRPMLSLFSQLGNPWGGGIIVY